MSNLKKIRLNYVYNQSVWYYCEKCGQKQTNLSKNVRKNNHLFCRKCQTQITNLKNFGVVWSSQASTIKNKKVKNSLRKWGVDSPNKVESIKVKQKQNRNGVEIGKKISEGRKNFDKNKYLKKCQKTSLKN